MINPSFWAGRRVLLTGHSGFKGSWLSLWLQKLGAEVMGFSLDTPTTPNRCQTARISQGIKEVWGDIRSLSELSAAMQAHQPEVVIHMAAQAMVRYSYDHPVETYAVNLMGTVHLLEAVRQCASVRSVVCVTTDKCYENKEWLWGYRENEPMGGFDPYSNSKGCAELAISSYRNSFFSAGHYDRHRTAVASVRAGNVIGGGDWGADRLVPDLVKAFAEKRAPLIRNPLATRPWQHVIEPLCGYLMLAERLYEKGMRYAEGWNFGPDDAGTRPVQWIADNLASLWGEGAKWDLDKDAHPHEAMSLRLDCSKAHALLGWHQVWPLETSLAMIVDWYKAYRDGGDVRAVCLDQITAYEQACAKA